MLYKYIRIACIVFSAFNLLVSCKEKAIKGVPREISIDNYSVKDTFDISAIIDTLTITKFTESELYPLTSPYQIYSLGDRGYVIFDSEPGSAKIMHFDKSGKFVEVLLRNGVKENETINLIDCWMDERGLIAYDFASHQIHVYDSSMKFTKKIKGKKLLHYFHLARLPNNEKYVGFANYNLGNPTSAQIDFLDKKLNATDSYFEFSKSLRDVVVLTYNNSFYRYKDSLRFVKHYDPYIYTADEDGIHKTYKIRYSKGNIETDQVDSIIRVNVDEFDPNRTKKRNTTFKFFNNYTFPYSTLLESDRYMYLTSLSVEDGNRSLFNSLFSKMEGKTVFSAKNLIETKAYKMSVPAFIAYDNSTGNYMSLVVGKTLTDCLTPESPLLKSLNPIDPSSFYLIQVKLF